METTRNDLRERVRDALENRIRPRDEVMMLRRLVAVHLGQNLSQDSVSNPLSLVDANSEPSNPSDLKGLEREYVEAVKKNLKAREEIAKVQQQHAEMQKSLVGKPEVESKILDLHLQVTKLERRHDQLKVAQKYLDQLEKQPAAAPDFLDPETMYKGCSPLPEIPPEILNGYGIDHNAADAEVEQMLQNMRKTVLRNKLLARKEQQRRKQDQVETPVDPKSLSPEAKVQALTAVKNALINWIELQLSKAGDGGESDDEILKQTQEKENKFDQDAHIAEIQREYARHIELRKEILDLLALRHRLESAQPPDPETESKPDESSATTASPTTPLLIPCIEQLHALAQEQKSLIQEKSHINASLAKQQEDTKLALDHLAQESQLLPRHAPAKATKPRLSFGSFIKSASQLGGVQKQLEPWINAADSAKIATLETVADKVEEGMLSTEEARATLEEICKLLNVDLPREPASEGQVLPEADLWLPDGDDEKPANATRRQEGKDETKGPKTIWSILDGNLGSINE